MKIEKLQKILSDIESWYSLVGKKDRLASLRRNASYGYLFNVNLDGIDIKIHHQEYDGAKNYHEIPKEIAPYLNKAIKNNFSIVLEEAKRILKKEIKIQAADTKKIYEKKLEDLQEYL